jgi:HD-like signal output (HDOD) protein
MLKEIQIILQNHWNLPDSIIQKIIMYSEHPVATIFKLQSNPIAKLIREEIKNYTIDHSYYFTSIYKKYYIKNILSFKQYYFDKKENPDEYQSNH